MRTINPYNSQDARQYSSYFSIDKPIRETDADHAGIKQSTIKHVANQLKTFLIEKEHPCIIARSTIRNDSCRFGVYPELGSKGATAGLSRDLIRFLEESKILAGSYASFMAVFQTPLSMSESVFEKKLWHQLELLQKASMPYYDWDSTTSSNPDDNKFGFSFGGKAFYIVGMHMNSSRLSRQFDYPMLVFNLHEQFEAMRTTGNYDKVKSVIRRNDKKLQGTINPMLRDFGDASEARQYSGRAVPDNWKCPYLHNI